MARPTHLVSCLTILLLWPLSVRTQAETEEQTPRELLKWSELAPLPDLNGFAAPIVGVADGGARCGWGIEFS